MHNRVLIIGAVILALLLVLWLAISGLRSGNGEDEISENPITETEAPIEASVSADTPLNFDHVWNETSSEYDSECDEGCIEVLNRPHGSHGGSVRVGLKPYIDDPVAQWSDCVQSIMSCYEGQLAADDFEGQINSAMHDCVLSSACPTECRDHYQSTVSDDLDSVNGALDAVFLGERAACLPTEAWVE